MLRPRVSKIGERGNGERPSSYCVDIILSSLFSSLLFSLFFSLNGSTPLDEFRRTKSLSLRVSLRLSLRLSLCLSLSLRFSPTNSPNQSRRRSVLPHSTDLSADWKLKPGRFRSEEGRGNEKRGFQDKLNVVGETRQQPLFHGGRVGAEGLWRMTPTRTAVEEVVNKRRIKDRRPRSCV
ncbi:hypothetical protein F2Q69_00032317 [Brassica cretica]|uniref:Transmembrane protein n=1 Tax=Brassica cretica TaxID=69181 RepID=A0A8S9S882_BRACR|nr:hypothetical protein F2Q69_00032317 [Brassica cretica]